MMQQIKPSNAGSFLYLPGGSGLKHFYNKLHPAI